VDDDAINARLRAADDEWTVPGYGQALADILDARPDWTLADIEERLRDLGSETYLVARPLSELPPGTLVLQFRTFAPAQTWLWICLNGIVERDALLTEIDSDEEDNLAELAYCGCPTTLDIKNLSTVN
jgi:hypothetical protein